MSNALQPGIDEEEALERGLKDKSTEFLRSEEELYRNV
jgi:hypothetical protein